ncbi:signal peptide prediction [Ramlibacter terrae]|uniref:Signal peptide prediction n=1 Tax=Ramlibacter terrae TaxID=2732511 RepID=A0ABX6P552_9BURK|nr:signal peptide prediction [Ramlibacter terrae]
MPLLLRALKYARAGPYSAVGVLLGVLILLSGGTWRSWRGTLEFGGGGFGRLVSRMPQPLRFSAMTLGHVILGVDTAALADLRPHEHVHVRQYERWGPLFLPAYLLSSLVQLLRGRNPYRENHFERQAFALAPARRAMQRDPGRG